VRPEYRQPPFLRRPRRPGYAEIINERNNPTPFVDNGYMAFGRDNEAWIVASLKDEFGIFPNDWLIGCGRFRKPLAVRNARRFIP